MECVEAAISALVADECNRVLGQELSAEEEAALADVVREAKNKELGEWKSSRVSRPLKAGDFGKSAADTRQVLPRKMVEGAGD